MFRKFLKNIQNDFGFWLYRIRYNPAEGICYCIGFLGLIVLVWALFFAKN